MISDCGHLWGEPDFAERERENVPLLISDIEFLLLLIADFEELIRAAGGEASGPPDLIGGEK